MPQGDFIPQVLVNQEFESTPSELTDPLRAFIAGPCYALFRYTETTERESTDVGASYDPFSETCFLWPNRPAGAVVDQDFAKGLVQYRLCARHFGTDMFDKNIAITLFSLGRNVEALAAFESLAQKRPDDPVIRKYLQRLRSR